MENALKAIEAELNIQTAALKAKGNLLEAQRLIQRTKYDMEMLI